MGRIRAKWVKNLSRELIKKFPDKYGKDFEGNKKSIDDLKLIESKVMRNRLAGCITRDSKKKGLSL